jgi:hypothetical protein
MGQMKEKKTVASGNEAVFRGSFQFSRVIFPGGAKLAGSGQDLNSSQSQISSAGQRSTD